MNIEINQVPLGNIDSLRRLFLKENVCQIRYDACHSRGWSDSYLIKHNNTPIGYGSVKGFEKLSDRDALFEFYLIQSVRYSASEIFLQLLRTAKIKFVESQSNLDLLSSLLYVFCTEIYSDSILFVDGPAIDFKVPEVIFSERDRSDTIFEHQHEPIGEYVLKWKNEVVATGGYATHYNEPFVDLYMEVSPAHRRKGFGSFLIRQLKDECHRRGLVPAARCSVTNFASRSTLKRGGLTQVGHMLVGTVNPALPHRSKN